MKKSLVIGSLLLAILTIPFDSKAVPPFTAHQFYNEYNNIYKRIRTATTAEIQRAIRLGNVIDSAIANRSYRGTRGDINKFRASLQELKAAPPRPTPPPARPTKAEEEARRRAAEEARRVEAARRRAEEARRRVEETRRRKEEEEARRRAPGAPPAKFPDDETRAVGTQLQQVKKTIRDLVEQDHLPPDSENEFKRFIKYETDR